MKRVFWLALAVLTLGIAPAQAAKRALIIGNNEHTELPDLQKAVADAAAYEVVLTELGYIVTLETDLSTSLMQVAIGDFIDSILPGDEVAFVFAGHGWSDGSSNYVVGSDASAQTSLATLRRSAIPLRNGANGVIDDMRTQGARVVLSIVDACRNNPFQSKLGRSGSVGLTRGLAVVAPVSGTFSVYSAGAGEEALDRLGDEDGHPNSVFSRVFLKELRQGGSLQDIVLDTAPRVAELAEQVGHSQRPAYYDGIGRRYCLTEACQRKASGDLAEIPVLTPVATPEAQVIETALAQPRQKPPLPAAPLEVPSELITTPVAPSVEPLSRDQITIAASPEPIQDPYFRPDPVVRPALAPAQRVKPARAGGPVQFIVRSASPVRTVNGLKHDSVCSVKRTPQQPTIERFFSQRGFSVNNRKFVNLKTAIAALERSRCNGLAVPPRLVSRVIGMVRDPSRYVVLPEIVQ